MKLHLSAIIAILGVAFPLSAQRRPATGSTTSNSSTANNLECDISGQVAMTDSSSKRGLEVVLETADHIRTQSTFTDADGRFQFHHLTLQPYYLYMNIQGYLTIEQPVVFQQAGPFATAVAVLELNRGLSDNDAEAKPPGDPSDKVEPEAPAGVIAADLFKKYAPKAVQEYQNGLDEKKKGNVNKAVNQFEKATGHDATFFEAWLELGQGRQQLGRFDPAGQAFERARALQPQSAQPLIELGGLHLDRAHKLETDGNAVQPCRNTKPV